MEKTVGRYAFILGVLIAVVLGVAALYLSESAVLVLTSFLVIFGLLVGLLNVADSQVKDFLLFSTVLIIAAGIGSVGTTFSTVSGVGVLLDGIFNHLLVFLVPAVTVVSLKAVLAMAKPERRARRAAPVKAKRKSAKKKRKRR